MREKDEHKIALNIIQFIFALILLVMALFSFIGCGTIKEVPIQTIEKVVVKDSIVYIKDSILIEVPVEKIVQMVPQDTTSKISTSLAYSEAKVESGILTHTLEQKGEIKAKIDTFYVTQIKEVEKLVEVPVEVVVTEYKRDNIFWFSIIFNIIAILYIAFRIYIKVKGVS